MRGGLLAVGCALAVATGAGSASAHGFAPEAVNVTRVPSNDGVARYTVSRVDPAAGVEIRWPHGCVLGEDETTLVCASGFSGIVSATELARANRQVLVRRVDREQVTTRLLTAQAPAATFHPAAAPTRGVVAHARVGFWHVITGADHVLFLLALVVLVGRARRLLLAVTAFTAAHCASVLTGVLGGTLPQAPVEFAIAGSIVVLALAIVRQEATSLTARPWAAAAVFGLIHGLAFAGVLRQLNVSPGQLPAALLGFNLGVEAGQIAVVLGTASVLWLLVRTGVPKRTSHLALAYGVGAAGVFWGLQRAAGLLGGSL